MGENKFVETDSNTIRDYAKALARIAELDAALDDYFKQGFFEGFRFAKPDEPMYGGIEYHRVEEAKLKEHKARLAAKITTTLAAVPMTGETK